MILKAALGGVRDRYLQALSQKGKLRLRRSMFYFKTVHKYQNQGQDLGLLIPIQSHSFNKYLLRPYLGPGFKLSVCFNTWL